MTDHPPEYRRPSGTNTGMPYIVFEVRKSVLRIYHAKHIGEAILVKAEWERGVYDQTPGHKRKLPVRVVLRE